MVRQLEPSGSVSWLRRPRRSYPHVVVAPVGSMNSDSCPASSYTHLEKMFKPPGSNSIEVVSPNGLVATRVVTLPGSRRSTSELRSS